MRQHQAPARRASGASSRPGSRPTTRTKHFFQEIVDTAVAASASTTSRIASTFFRRCAQAMCRFSLAHHPGRSADQADDSCFLRDAPRARRVRQYVFTLSRPGHRALNPNTRTCPVFRTRRDAELTKAIYRRVPVLSATGLGRQAWEVQFTRCSTCPTTRTCSALARARSRRVRAGGQCLVSRRGACRSRSTKRRCSSHFDHRYGDTMTGVPRRTAALDVHAAARALSLDERHDPGMW